MNSIVVHPKNYGLTVEDYLKTQAGPPWYQLVDGRLLLEPSPTSDHQSVVRELIISFGTYLKEFPIGTLFCAPLDVYLNETNVFQPDVVVILNSRRKIVTPRGIRGAPDFVVEILSPANHRIDRGPKRYAYARAGVREMWIVDPKVQSIDSFLLENNPETPVQIWRRDDTLTSELFPGFSISANEIFN